MDSGRPYALVTAGATSVKIDDIVITNPEEGDTGVAIANALARRGIPAMLILSRLASYKHRDNFAAGVEPIVYTFFDEYVNAIRRVVEWRGQPSYAFSTAAVSDFAPVRVAGKIASGGGAMIELRELPKVLNTWRSLFGPECMIVGFKYLSMKTSTPTDLLDAAIHQNERAALNFTVANFKEDIVGDRHPLWVMRGDDGLTRLDGSTDSVARELVEGIVGSTFKFDRPEVWRNPIKAAGVRIRCRRSGRVLFLKRATESFADEWTFPGGRMDPTDATPLVTALRECREETGTDVTRIASECGPGRDHLIRTVVSGKVRYFLVRYFPLDVEEEFVPTLSVEHSEHRWATPKEARSLHTGVATSAVLNDTCPDFTA